MHPSAPLALNSPSSDVEVNQATHVAGKGLETCPRPRPFLKDLAVVHRRVRHPVAPCQLVLAVDDDGVLVAIVTLAVLLCPARIRILLPTLGRLVGPGIG